MIAIRPSAAGTLALVAVCGIVGGVTGFVLVYDVPDVANRVITADWRRNASRSGADLAALAGLGAGLLVGAALTRAWRAVIGSAIGAVLGIVLGFLIGGLIGGPMSAGIGAGIGSLIAAALGFLIGLGSDLARGRPPGASDAPDVATS